MDSKELQERTEQFAHRCVKLALALPERALGDHIQKQLIRCSTSVACNYRAAFVSKLSIVVEEIDESCFWLKFVVDEGLLSSKKMRSLLSEAEEFACIFVSARKTSRSRK